MKERNKDNYIYLNIIYIIHKIVKIINFYIKIRKIIKNDKSKKKF